MITFLLNQDIREESDLSPDMTVLNYLRTRIRKTGTKEGCGSGDCGACTVVLGELVNGKLEYHSVNSCLTFVSALHGKQLITVEDLQNGDKSLHPVQKAMVEFHGSQCGYCTPGFIMSMFALSKNKPEANRHDVLEALAGNLCRCTGYRPIVDAALSLSSGQPILDQFSHLEAETIRKLESIKSRDARLIQGEKQAFSPKTVDELAALYLQYPDARLVAGGTDLALEVTQLHQEINTLISVSLIDEMKVCKEIDGQLVIGANLPISAAYPLINQHYPDFGALLHRFASLQVRNQGTLGGNIANASPIGDTPPLLIALNASIQLRHGSSTRVLPIEEYFISYRVTSRQPSEFIEQILIPLPQQKQIFRAYKLSKRLDDDISAVCGAFNLQIDNDTVIDARVAFGGMAAIPKRAERCEQALIGQKWNEATLALAMQALTEDFEPLSDFRASKEYRAITAANMLRRCYIEQTHTSHPIETRVTSYV